jgi:hypothetical protein
MTHGGGDQQSKWRRIRNVLDFLRGIHRANIRAVPAIFAFVGGNHVHTVNHGDGAGGTFGLASTALDAIFSINFVGHGYIPFRSSGSFCIAADLAAAG